MEKGYRRQIPDCMMKKGAYLYPSLETYDEYYEVSTEYKKRGNIYKC